MGKCWRTGLQEAGAEPLLYNTFPCCCRILETKLWDVFEQWFAASVCLLRMMKFLVEMLCHSHPPPEGH